MLPGCGNRSVARAVLDGPSAIAETRQPNAQVKARELIIVLVNFGFIVIVSFCLSSVVFGLLWLLVLRSHFWPFTGVQNGNQREVTTKCGELFQTRGNKRQGRLYLVPYE
jgi:hypothetical protein